LIPGTGFPLVINSTMCANDVGYGAGGSLVVVGGGMIPLASVLGGSSLFVLIGRLVVDALGVAVPGGSISSTTEEARTLWGVGGVGGGRLRALR